MPAACGNEDGRMPAGKRGVDKLLADYYMRKSVSGSSRGVEVIVQHVSACLPDPSTNTDVKLPCALLRKHHTNAADELPKRRMGRVDNHVEHLPTRPTNLPNPNRNTDAKLLNGVYGVGIAGKVVAVPRSVWVASSDLVDNYDGYLHQIADECFQSGKPSQPNKRYHNNAGTNSGSSGDYPSSYAGTNSDDHYRNGRNRTSSTASEYAKHGTSPGGRSTVVPAIERAKTKGHASTERKDSGWWFWVSDEHGALYCSVVQTVRRAWNF